MTIQIACGIIAGAIQLATCPIYVSSILKGTTKPDRVTWWILALVSGMLTMSSFAAGARETIWLPIAYTLSFATVGVFSLKYGDGPVALNTIDRICLAGAVMSLLVWWLSGSAFLALVLNITTDFIALIPTIWKIYQRPRTEGILAWALAAIASALNIFAITDWAPGISAYPVYLLVMNTLIVLLLISGRRREGAV